MIILAAMAGLITGFTGPQAVLGETVRETSELYGDIERTELSSLTVSVLASGARVDWSLKNEGQTLLRQFDKWDLIVLYQDSPSSGLQAQRLTYTSDAAPASGEWTVSGIYQDAGSLTAEVFDPGIINPAEEFILRAQLSPSISTPTTNTMTLAVANGVKASTQFAN